jgi:hypothetical protein
MAAQEISHPIPATDRETAIRLLLFPQNYLLPTKCDQTSELRRTIRENPEKLEMLGISRLPVFSATCTDPHRGTWTVGRFQIWVDKNTEPPLDSPTVKIIDRLPESVRNMKPSDLLLLLNPTYCRSREDAQTLVEILNAAGPSSSWVDPSSL